MPNYRFRLKNIFFFAGLVVLQSFVFIRDSQSQVYKCTTQNGKISFSDVPCAFAGQKEQTLQLKIKPTLSIAEPKDWAKENEAFKQRQREREQTAQLQLNRQTSSSASNTKNPAYTKQLIANCEANHGMDCSNPNSVAQLQRQNIPLTTQELQQAIGERRAMQREAEEYRFSNR
ncbi:DUF4124 domain-containing protein [Undibacterium sp. RuRC25W]|uniref:DUF4124 domain-containing protein n=1 Tax=Undibacterium sp. RuRC25W TaxID=3413047 RepID=UPI003BEFA404